MSYIKSLYINNILKDKTKYSSIFFISVRIVVKWLSFVYNKFSLLLHYIFLAVNQFFNLTQYLNNISKIGSVIIWVTVNQFIPGNCKMIFSSMKVDIQNVLFFHQFSFVKVYWLQIEKSLKPFFLCNPWKLMSLYIIETAVHVVCLCWQRRRRRSRWVMRSSNSPRPGTPSSVTGGSHWSGYVLTYW